MWLILVTILSVLIYSWIQRRRKHFSLFQQLGVPGPEPGLLLGNAYDYFIEGHCKLFKEWHKKYGSVIGIFMGYKPMMLVSDVELLKNVFIRDFTDFTDRDQINGSRLHRDSLLSSHGSLWKNMRRIITPSFTSSKLKALTAPMHDAIKQFTENLDENLDKEIDIKTFLQALTLDVVARNAFGVNYNLQKDPENNEFFKVTRRFMNQGTDLAQFVFLGLDANQWLLDLVRKFRFRRGEPGMKNIFSSVLEECAEIVKARKSHKSTKNDLLQLLMDARASASDNVEYSELTAKDDADNVTQKTTTTATATAASKTGAVKLTDSQIVQNSFAVLVAGFETTASTMSYFINVMIHRPDVQQRLREEIFDNFEDPQEIHDYDKLQKLRYLDAVIKETLRMFPPVGPFAIRTAHVDKVYGKWKIPKGMHVIASINDIHYSPTYWKNPDSFEPTRFFEGEPSDPSAWLPFGLGPRNCVGIRFALLEMKMIIAELLWHFRIEKSPNSPAFPPEVEALNVLARLKGSLNCKVVRNTR